MWFKVKSFIYFLLKSTNQHGVHSPFVYNLVTKCFYKNTNQSKINTVTEIKKWLKTNENTITVSDFGKGSTIFKSNERKIAEIVKYAGISKIKSALLIRLVEYFNVDNILEIGTSVGLGSATLSTANPNSKIETLEGCKNTSNVAQELFDNFKLKNVNLTIGEFKNTLPNVLKNKSFDLIYFDGNHQREATLNYFNHCLKNIHNESIFIFDDINWSIEMQQTWAEIIKHPKVTVSIDLYFWGIIFFRKEQKKQHFTIRI